MTSVQGQLSEGLREADGVFQIDDELLAVLLPRTSTGRAADVADKLRVLIASLHLKNGKVTRQLTACMGISGTRHATSAETVLDQARGALDEACREGPNTIRSHAH